MVRDSGDIYVPFAWVFGPTTIGHPLQNGVVERVIRSGGDIALYVIGTAEKWATGRHKLNSATYLIVLAAIWFGGPSDSGSCLGWASHPPKSSYVSFWNHEGGHELTSSAAFLSTWVAVLPGCWVSRWKVNDWAEPQIIISSTYL